MSNFGDLIRIAREKKGLFLRQVAANSATNWHYDSPIRFHVGSVDEALHPTLARRPVAAGGGQATEVTVVEGSHRVTFMASLYGEPKHLAGEANALEWFNSLRRN